MPITNLTEKDVVALMQKDLDRRKEKLDQYCKAHGISLEDDSGGDDSSKKKPEEKNKKPEKISVDTLARGIRVKHRDSGLEYTVQRVDHSTGEVVLRNPTDVFDVSFQEMEAEYVID